MFNSFLKHREITFSHFSNTCLTLFVFFLLMFLPSQTQAQQKGLAGAGQRAVVVDERLAVLRDEPGLSASLLKRLSRGRMVTIVGAKQTRDGLRFYRVAVTRRTRGWLQSEAVASPARKGDDERLLSLIRASKDFDRIARASIFLEMFTRSPLRPQVLLLFGDAAEEVAGKLSQEANRRLDADEMQANNAPVSSYFLSYSGLDRYRRLGIAFIFDQTSKKYHYDGASWREIMRRYPQSAEAREARSRLAKE